MRHRRTKEAVKLLVMGTWLLWLCSSWHQLLPPEEEACTRYIGHPTSLHAETVEQHPAKSKCWELWPLFPISCSLPALLRIACTLKLHPWSPDMVTSHTYQVPLALIFWTVYLHLRPFPYTLFFFWLCWVFVAVHRLCLVRMCWFGCLTACGILVPLPGIKHKSPALELGFLTIGSPTKSSFPFILSYLHILLIHLSIQNSSCRCLKTQCMNGKLESWKSRADCHWNKSLLLRVPTRRATRGSGV